MRSTCCCFFLVLPPSCIGLKKGRKKHSTCCCFFLLFFHPASCTGLEESVCCYCIILISESLKVAFFSSVAADLALRLGPDSERSGKKVCKLYETLWLHKRGTSWKNQNNEKKHGNSDDPQISRPDLRFASRENSETTQNGAGATPNKNHKNPWGLPPDTIGSSPPCLRNMHKRSKSLWPKQINRG